MSNREELEESQSDVSLTEQTVPLHQLRENTTL